MTLFDQLFPFTLAPVTDSQDLGDLTTFMDHRPQHYDARSYRDWVHGKCATRVGSGVYLAYVAKADGRVVGDLILAPKAPDTVEIKNLRVVDLAGIGGRGIGPFLFRQAEAYQQMRGGGNVAWDISSTNREAEAFFLRMGGCVIGEAALYRPELPDLLFEKRVGPYKNASITHDGDTTAH